MKKHFVIFIFTLAALLFLNQFWIPRGISLSFDYKLDHPVELEVFYASDADDAWAGHRMVRHKTSTKEGKAEIFLPVLQLERLRIDPGSKPVHVVMRNMRLQGEDTLILGSKKHDFRTRNIAVKNESEGEVRVASKHADPILVYNKPLSMQAGQERNFNLLNFLIVIFTPGYLIYAMSGIWHDIRNNKDSEKHPAILNIEFLRVFFTLGVLLCHFRDTLYGLWCAGHFGVEFFFILSGYLLAITFRQERAILDIAKRNWIRFVPLIVVTCMICHGGWHSFMGAFMLQSTGLAMHLLADPPSWYVAVLFWCSIFYLGLLKSVTGEKRNFIIGVIVFCAYLLVVRGKTQGWLMLDGLAPKEIFRGIAGMGAGILLSLVCRRDTVTVHTSLKKMVVLGALEALLLFYFTSICFTSKYFISHWIMQPILAGILLYLFIRKQGFISILLEKNIFARCAKYCLSIYLTHWIFFVYRFWQIEGNITLSVLNAIILSILAGILFYYLIEKPFVKLLTPALTKKK